MEGERSNIVAFCATNNLAIVSTMFPHKNIHKHIWTSPNGLYQNQIDHVAVSFNFKRYVQDVRAYRGADVASDHNLMAAKTMLKLNETGRRGNIVRRYEISKLEIPGIREQFQLELRNRFSCLEVKKEDDKENSGENTPQVVADGRQVEKKWGKIRDAYRESARTVLGYRKRNDEGRF